jgi:cytidyltransferase-like protein
LEHEEGSHRDPRSGNDLQNHLKKHYMEMPVPHGQTIGLKPGSEEPYIILHKNTFPGVLDRIARSNIRNYSIFMHNRVLFGFYLYCGLNYPADMDDLSKDSSTKEWWKLTAPLQEPLATRNPGDWWFELTPVYHYQDNNSHDNALKRYAFLIGHHTGILSDPLRDPGFSKKGIVRLLLFQGIENSFLYFEVGIDFANEDKIALLNKFHLKNDKINEMTEVFHTEGNLPGNSQKKVFVTGCFDMLHSGHIEFLREASSYGDLYVGIGSDANIFQLKGRTPVNSQEERKYMLNAVRHVHTCIINNGWGIMDFLEEIDQIRPDIFIVNEDGNTPAKVALCERLGIEYKVLKRIPHEGFPARSTTALRQECHIPFRIDLAGGWLDQPFVSKYYPGPVLTISIEPTLEFNDRSGMASSTRRKAVELWKTDIPAGNHEGLAKILFSYDNPPGTMDVSGSQDSLGIVLPGLNRLYYNGGYWPEKIMSVHQEDILTWLENHLYLVTLGPRQADYQVVVKTNVNTGGAKSLSIAAEQCWDAILLKDIKAFGEAFRLSFEAQVAMFPNMVDDNIRSIIGLYSKQAFGWKLSGAGGGGYLILVTDKPVEGAIRIKIRRKQGI